MVTPSAGHAGPEEWTFAPVFEGIAAWIGDRPAFVEADGSTVTWTRFMHGARSMAATLVDQGLSRPDAVAVFMRNSSIFLETYVASFIAGLVPVNVNYRYGADETKYLIGDSGARAVVYHAAFRNVIDAVRQETPEVAIWIEVPDGTGETLPHGRPTTDASWRRRSQRRSLRGWHRPSRGAMIRSCSTPGARLGSRRG